MYKSRFDDNKVIALVALLIATLICVIVLYTLTFVLDVRSGTVSEVNVQSCYPPSED